MSGSGDHDFCEKNRTCTLWGGHVGLCALRCTRCDSPNHNGEPCQGYAPGPGGYPKGYHAVEIKRGEFGEISKIQEEFEEFLDATDQGITVMQLVELSDMLGAIEGWLQKYHPNVTLEQLTRMKDATARAFRNGVRKPR